MKKFKTKYFRAGQFYTVFVYAPTKEEARNRFFANFLGADLIEMEEEK